MKIYKYTHGKNLIDYTATDVNKGFISGKYLNSSGTPTAPGSGVAWNVSQYIDVSNLTHLKVEIPGNTASNPSICYYDANKTFISGTAYSARESFGEVIPEEAQWVRFSYSENAQTRGWSVYDPRPKWRETEGYQYKAGENLFDAATNNVTTGKYIDSNGGVADSAPLYVDSDTYNYTDYIPVEADKNYRRTWHGPAFVRAHGMSVAWYNSSKTFLLRSAGTQYNTGTTDAVDNFTAPANAAYVRLNFSSETWPNSNVTLQFYDTAVEWRETTAHEYSSGSWD